MIPGLDLNRLFEGVETRDTVIVAVSGGSDSIALLMLASAWARSVDADLHVVTIDHGLRPEAAAEAAFVAGVCEGLDLPHITLAWDGIKPLSGISSAARNARYRLLEEFAGDIGVNTILAGHTADDQAETILMRNRRASNYSLGRGLSGMARTTRLPNGTRLIRPLLGITRQTLRAYLRDLNQSWIEDPSNMDESFERVRVRKHLDGDEKRIAEICRFASLMARERALNSEAISDFLSKELKVEAGPVYHLPLNAMEKLEPHLQVFGVQLLAALAGGGDHFISIASVARFFDFPSEMRMTMGNAILERHDGVLRLYREKRNLPGILIAPDESVVWDGRLRIRNESNTTYYCGPMDSSHIAEAENLLGRKLPVRPRAALGGMPFISGDGDDLCLPFVKGFEVPAGLKLSMCCPAIEFYCPEQEFALLDLLDSIRGAMKALIHHKR